MSESRSFFCVLIKINHGYSAIFKFLVESIYINF
jgi:hypothetical protein